MDESIQKAFQQLLLPWIVTLPKSLHQWNHKQLLKGFLQNGFFKEFVLSKAVVFVRILRARMFRTTR